MKKFEEGVFSDLRNLKPGVDACLEEPKVSIVFSRIGDRRTGNGASFFGGVVVIYAHRHIRSCHAERSRCMRTGAGCLPDYVSPLFGFFIECR